MRAKDAVGRYGEDVAEAHVRDRGWDVLDRNWRTRDGELDLVALDGDELVVSRSRPVGRSRSGTPRRP